jgi:hypothetical protein
VKRPDLGLSYHDKKTYKKTDKKRHTALLCTSTTPILIIYTYLGRPAQRMGVGLIHIVVQEVGLIHIVVYRGGLNAH